jgi:hypothetical protein
MIALMLTIIAVTCIVMKKRKQDKIEDLTLNSTHNLPKVMEAMPHSKVFRATEEEEGGRDHIIKA